MWRGVTVDWWLLEGLCLEIKRDSIIRRSRLFEEAKIPKEWGERGMSMVTDVRNRRGCKRSVSAMHTNNKNSR